MKSSLLSCVLAMGVINLCRAADAPPASADSLLSAAKEAMGGAALDKIVTWHEQDKITAGGLKGTDEGWTDLPTLHFSGSYILGPDSGGQGYDGKVVWTTDASKVVRIETSEQALSQAVQDVYRGSYAFLFPSRYPATSELAGTKQADGKSYQAVKITPKGADPFEVWFDPTTHLVAREVQLMGGHPHTFLFSDYQNYGGVMVPRRTIDRIGNDPQYDQVTDVASISFGPQEDASRYAPPPPPADISQWPAGKDSVTLPFKLINNHIYFDVSINGSAPLTFLFDTGATNFMQAGVARVLGITAEGKLPGGGVGEKLESTGLAKVKSTSIGGFALPDQVFGVDDGGAWVAIEGVKSAGIVGYEFARRSVVTIDYEGHTITFTKPAAFHPPAGVAAVPFAFSNHIPMISAQIDEASGSFMVDTGSRAAVMVMGPFEQSHRLVEKYHATTLSTIGYGVGGPARAKLARAGQLTIGSVTIPAPVIEFITNKSGVGADTHTAGNIGGDILKRFTVTLDYEHQQLWLQPNALARQREVFDRSGLWISRAKDGGIQVVDVNPESAAAKAGLVAGDEIVDVQGKPAAHWELGDLREAFKGDVGTKIALVVRSKGAEHPVDLALADQI
jgi:hypothetical protein